MSIKLSRSYPADSMDRYTKDPDLIGVNNANIDAAMVEPVQIMNQVLGYRTFGSCEGHKDMKNPHLIIKKKPKSKTILLHGAPFSSYIGFLLPITELNPLIDFLNECGFEEPLAYIAHGKIQSPNPEEAHEYIKELDGTVLVFSIGGWLEGDCYKVSIHILPIENPKSHKEWDNMRDKGFEVWLNILYNFKKNKSI